MSEQSRLERSTPGNLDEENSGSGRIPQCPPCLDWEGPRDLRRRGGPGHQGALSAGGVGSLLVSPRQLHNSTAGLGPDEQTEARVGKGRGGLRVSPRRVNCFLFKNYFYFFIGKGVSHHASHADLELLDSSEPPPRPSKVLGSPLRPARFAAF